MQHTFTAPFEPSGSGGAYVTVPDDLAAALAEARVLFDGLAYSHRREYVQWIAEARREETRARRVVRAVEMLRAGRKGR